MTGSELKANDAVIFFNNMKQAITEAVNSIPEEEWKGMFGVKSRAIAAYSDAFLLTQAMLNGTHSH